MEAPLRAYRGLDCARNARVHYLLPHPVDARFYALFPDAQLSVQEFSKQAANAHDHFTLVRGVQRITGVVGSERVVVHFGRCAIEGVDQDIAALEGTFVAAGWGPVEYVKRLKDVM